MLWQTNGATNRMNRYLLAVLLLTGWSKASAQQDSTRRYQATLSTSFGVQQTDFAPINTLLTDNGFRSVRPIQSQVGVALTFGRSYVPNPPFTFDVAFLVGNNSNGENNTRTSLTSGTLLLGTNYRLFLKNNFRTGPRLGIGFRGTTFQMTKNFVSGSLPTYLSGQATGQSLGLSHITGLVDLGWRFDFMLPPRTSRRSGSLRSRSIGFSAGCLLGVGRRNWQTAGSMPTSFSDGPALNAGGFYLTLSSTRL